jgi:hypothetical protein
MTPAEYKDSLKGQRVDRGSPGFRYYNRAGQVEHDHYVAVNQALQMGKPVPLHVLAETRIDPPNRGILRRLVEEADRAGRPVPEALRRKAAQRGGPAFFSVAGALSPEEAEERATLRRVESYADRENARLRAVREGVGA